MPKTAKPARPARDLLTVELDPDTRAALQSLCTAEADRSGGRPDRLGSIVVRRLIRAAARGPALTERS